MTLPYPRPEAWTMNATQLTRRWPSVLWAVIAVVLVVLAFGANARGDVGWGILFAALFGAIGAAVGVSYQRSGAAHGLPMLINANVLTRAVVRPPDSWIHFFRESGPSGWLTTSFVVTGTLATVSLAWSAVNTIADGNGWWWFALVPLGLGALVLGIAGWLAVAIYVRHRSFGRRPIGISLGRHGVIRYYMDGADVWDWDNIASVRASGKVIDPDTDDFTAMLQLTPHTPSPDIADDEYDIAGSQSHPWLIYTAVRFWAEHPELRHELSTTYAQRRIEGWRDEMRAVAIESPASGTSAHEGR